MTKFIVFFCGLLLCINSCVSTQQQQYTHLNPISKYQKVWCNDREGIQSNFEDSKICITFNHVYVIGYFKNYSDLISISLRASRDKLLNPGIVVIMEKSSQFSMHEDVKRMPRFKMSE